MKLWGLLPMQGDAMQGAGEQRTGAVYGQQGMASIVVVSVLIIILTLISLGFARLISRSATNSANRQFSATATYAAQSAINDVSAYLKQYVNNNPANGFLPKSSKCNGDGSLIGTSTKKGPFYSATDISGNNNTHYTCLLLDPTPNDLSYPGVLNLKSQVVKVNTSAATGALDKLMISWQPTDPTITGYPTSASTLNDETTWNSSSGICKDGGTVASCTPVLRLTIFPISNGELISSAQAQSKTVYLYPQSPTGNVSVFAYSGAAFQDGSIIPIPCTNKIGANTFNPSTDSDYKCNIIIGALAGAISPATTDSVYLRLTPIYNQADIKIRANDKFGDSLSFIDDQAVIDVTAQTGGVAKRLKARVDISSLAPTSGGTDINISSQSDAIPEQSIRSANALCKRAIQVTPTNGFNKFIDYEEPDDICHVTTTANNPVPALDLRITGTNGQDNGVTVNSEANNLFSPQNPVQQGTVYVGSRDASGNITPGSINITWTSQHAEFCTGSGGNAGDGWAADETPFMSFTGSPPTTGNGSHAISNISNRTEYDLVCKRLGAPGDSATKKVFAWPHPSVSISGPSSVEAGGDYTISWTSQNAVRCQLSGGSWQDAGKTGTSDSETMNWPSNDNSSTRTFTVTCFDPAGRSDVRTRKVGTSITPIVCNPGDPGCPGGGCPNCGSQVIPPTCRVAAWYSGDVNPPDSGSNFGGNFSGSYSGTAINWATNCDYWDAANNGASRYINYTKDGVSVWTGYASSIWMTNGSFPITSTGTYCFQVYLWADPWATEGDAAGYGSVVGGGLANSGKKCITIGNPQVVIDDFYVKAWDNGPYECGHWLGADNNKWKCRNGSPYLQDPLDGFAFRATTRGGGGGWGCADDDHRFGVCFGEDYIYSRLADGSTGGISCQQYSDKGAYGPAFGGGSQPNGPWQWTNILGVYPFHVICNGPTPGPSGGPNTACKGWNAGDDPAACP